MNTGTQVKFIGASAAQVRWAHNDDPRENLEIGGIYTVEEIEMHSWHTEVILREFPTLRFNSVHFAELDTEED